MALKLLLGAVVVLENKSSKRSTPAFESVLSLLSILSFDDLESVSFLPKLAAAPKSIFLILSKFFRLVFLSFSEFANLFG